jgi:hypothetical protein
MALRYLVRHASSVARPGDRVELLEQPDALTARGPTRTVVLGAQHCFIRCISMRTLR